MKKLIGKLILGCMLVTGANAQSSLKSEISSVKPHTPGYSRSSNSKKTMKVVSKLLRTEMLRITDSQLKCTDSDGWVNRNFGANIVYRASQRIIQSGEFCSSRKNICNEGLGDRYVGMSSRTDYKAYAKILQKRAEQNCKIVKQRVVENNKNTFKVESKKNKAIVKRYLSRYERAEDIFLDGKPFFEKKNIIVLTSVMETPWTDGSYTYKGMFKYDGKRASFKTRTQKVKDAEKAAALVRNWKAMTGMPYTNQEIVKYTFKEPFYTTYRETGYDGVLSTINYNTISYMCIDDVCNQKPYVKK